MIDILFKRMEAFGEALAVATPRRSCSYRGLLEVVRSIEAYRGSRDKKAAAAESLGFATSARIADAISGFSTFAVCSKNAFVVGFSATGNENRARRASASASS